MPDMNIKVVPTYGDRQYKYTLLQEFLSARIRNELKVRYALITHRFDQHRSIRIFF